ncbi:MAG: DUF1697 domain-containing protein [Gemmatimonadaceae bacterium]
MALVALLKGLNVGGHRRFRPSELAKQLKRFDVVNVGAAGTFVVRKPVSRTKLRAEITRRLPFETEVMMCSGSDILRLASGDPFAGQPSRPDIVRFVSLSSERRRPAPPVPLVLPSSGEWCLKVLGCEDRFVLGVHRRQMKAIVYLGQRETILGARVTTRSWSTILSIARILET